VMGGGHSGQRRIRVVGQELAGRVLADEPLVQQPGGAKIREEQRPNWGQFR